MKRLSPVLFALLAALPAAAGDPTPKQKYGDAVRDAAVEYQQEVRDAKVEYSRGVDAVRESWAEGAGQLKKSYEESVTEAKQLYAEIAKRAEQEYKEEVAALKKNDASKKEFASAEAAYDGILAEAKQQYGESCKRAKAAYEEGIAVLKAQYNGAVDMGLTTYREKVQNAAEKYRARLKAAYDELVGETGEKK
jgi:hypothetical protein